MALKIMTLKDRSMTLLVPRYLDELPWKQKQWLLWSRFQWVRTTPAFHTSGTVWYLFCHQRFQRHEWQLCSSWVGVNTLLTMPDLRGGLSSIGLCSSQSSAWPSVWENLQIWLHSLDCSCGSWENLWLQGMVGVQTRDSCHGKCRLWFVKQTTTFLPHSLSWNSTVSREGLVTE